MPLFSHPLLNLLMSLRNLPLHLPTLEHAIDPHPITITPDCPIAEAIALMSQAEGSNCLISCDLADATTVSKAIEFRSKSYVLVVENAQIIGIFTERDLVRLATLNFDLLTPIGQVMSQSVITLKQAGAQTLFSALSLFRQHRIRHLPVLDETDRLIGVITTEAIRQVLQPLNLLKWRQVSEVMTTHVVCAEASASVLQLAYLMTQHQVSCVVIVEPIERLPIGIVTERDIVQFQTLGLELAKVSAHAVMSAPLFTVRPSDLLLLTHQEMQQRHIRQLVVTDDRHQLIGIITQTSLLKIFDSMELYSVVNLLQETVEERTSELQHSNNQLRREIVDHERTTTKLRASEADLLQSLQKQQDLNELKSRFVAMASHDLRNPLTAIVLATNLLESCSERGNYRRQAVYLNRIRTAADYMTKLLNDLLLLGQVESGNLEITPAPLNLIEFCHSLIEELKLGTGTEHTIQLVTRGNCTRACLDDKLLHQILTNLMSNAIKYSPEADLVELDVMCMEGKAAFKIQDNGIGIPLQDQSQLFESFRRASNVGSIVGTGLGLAIVKRCVDLHQGEITFTSEVGKGTTFVVTLPIQHNAQAIAVSGNK